MCLFLASLSQASVMLKLVLKRFMLQNASTSRGHFKSKSTNGKDEDVEITTPTPSTDEQSASCSSKGSDFNEFSLIRNYRELASIDMRLIAGRLEPGETKQTSLIHAVSSLLQSLQVGRVVGRRQQDFVLLRSERARRQTYHDWQNAAITARALAKDGFYFTGVADVVQCVFCLGVLDDWVADDLEVPADEYPAYRHRHQLPYCPFTRGFDVRNIPDQDELQDLRLGDELDVSFTSYYKYFIMWLYFHCLIQDGLWMLFSV